MGSLAQVGLALATSIGAWINFVLVLWFARREGLFGFDAALRSSLGKLAIANGAFAILLLVAAPVVTALLPSWPSFREFVRTHRAGGCSAACSMARWSRCCSGGNGFRACACARPRRPRRPARRSRERLPRPRNPISPELERSFSCA